MLLRKRNDTLDKVKTVEFKATTTSMKINIGSLIKPETKTFYPDLKAVSYSRDNRHYLFMDIESATTYTFSSYTAQPDPRKADTMNATGLIATAVKMATSNFGLAVIIISAVAGLAFGFILGQNIESIVGAFQ